MNLFLQLLGNGLVQGAVAMLYAAGFGFVYRSFRVFHIAMGAQFVFSCYGFYTCVTVCKLPLMVSVPVVLALSAAFAALIECVVYHPFAQKRCSSGVVMIASLGVMIVVENVIALAFGNEVKTISNQLEPSVAFAGLRFTRIQLLQFFVGLGVFAAVGEYEIRPDPEELAGGRFWTPEEITRTLGQGILTPNFEEEYLRIKDALSALL